MAHEPAGRTICRHLDLNICNLFRHVGRDGAFLAGPGIDKHSFGQKGCCNFLRDGVQHFKETDKPLPFNADNAASNIDGCAGTLFPQEPDMMILDHHAKVAVCLQGTPMPQREAETAEGGGRLLGIELHIHVPHPVRLPCLHRASVKFDRGHLSLRY